MFSRIIRLISRIFESSSNTQTPVNEQPVSDPLKQSVQGLIAVGKTGEALQILIDAGYPVATLLKSQLDSGQSLFDQGKLPFEEWSRTMARINFAALNFFKKEEEEAPAPKKPFEPVPEIPITEAQRIKVQELILQHHTEDALALCAGLGVNFLLTQKRFLEGKKHWNMGLIAEEDWVQLQKQITEALLSFLKEHPAVK